MADKLTDKQKLDIALQNTKNLEKRVEKLEEQMAVTLQALRRLTEAEVAKKMGTKPAENLKN